MFRSTIGVKLSFSPQERPVKVHMKFVTPKISLKYVRNVRYEQQSSSVSCTGLAADLLTQLTFNGTSRVQKCSIGPIEVCTVVSLTSTQYGNPLCELNESISDHPTIVTASYFPDARPMLAYSGSRHAPIAFGDASHSMSHLTSV